MTGRKIIFNKADGKVLMTEEERASGGGRHLQSTGGSTMSSSASSDFGGSIASNNAAWKTGPGSMCIKNPRADGTNGGVVQEGVVQGFLCHQSFGTCGYWSAYL